MYLHRLILKYKIGTKYQSLQRRNRLFLHLLYLPDFLKRSFWETKTKMINFCKNWVKYQKSSSCNTMVDMGTIHLSIQQMHQVIMVVITSPMIIIIPFNISHLLINNNHTLIIPVKAIYLAKTLKNLPHLKTESSRKWKFHKSMKTYFKI